MCIDMCIDMCIGMCFDMCIDMCMHGTDNDCGYAQLVSGNEGVIVLLKISIIEPLKICIGWGVE